ncbi:hypothetical protein K435DRAFT_780741 [Dendrothele bispora CBS 962.96]|uniref:Uncharacterized protein n=1 Tax=Dendrothele bispora (strain CBS 962.96) TaxID=1314807 RepID=A0A4S8LQ02_DENBC|nr:hypothetical protein K435DRAFT_780741 [Dendrothele bispora CBS 962.96]
MIMSSDLDTDLTGENTLPNELWREIFALSCTRRPLDIVSIMRGKSWSMQWILPQVCRKWREAILDMPDLWTNISLDVDRLEEDMGPKTASFDPSRTKHIIRTILSRSRPKSHARSKPLKVSLTVHRPISDWGFEYLHILSEDCARWGSLYIQTTSTACFMDLASVSDRLVSLTHLSLEDPAPWDLIDEDPIDVVRKFTLSLGRLPSLTSLHLSHLPDELLSEWPESIWNNISRISTLNLSVQTMKGVLQLAKHLRAFNLQIDAARGFYTELRANFQGLRRVESEEDRVIHQCLTHLLLPHTDWFRSLEHLALPNLVELKIEKISIVRHFHVLSLVDFLRRSAPSLQTLKAKLRPGGVKYRWDHLHEHQWLTRSDYLIASDQITLTSLTSLYWDNSTPEYASLFDFLIVPSLSNLEVVNCASAYSLERVSYMIQRSSCSLHALRLEYLGLVDKTLETILQASPYLEYLVLEGVVHDHLLGKMTFPSNTEASSFPLLPCLKRLKILRAAGQIFSPKALTSMLRSRSCTNLEEVKLSIRPYSQKPVQDAFKDLAHKDLFAVHICNEFSNELTGPSHAPCVQIKIYRDYGRRLAENLGIIQDTAAVLAESLCENSFLRVPERLGGPPDENLRLLEPLLSHLEQFSGPIPKVRKITLWQHMRAIISIPQELRVDSHFGYFERVQALTDRWKAAYSPGKLLVSD